MATEIDKGGMVKNRHVLRTFITFIVALMAVYCAAAILPTVSLYVTPLLVPPPTPTTQPITATLSSSAVISLTSPIPHGAYARLSIQTVPGAGCYLGYVTPKGNGSTAQGLGDKMAGSTGVVAWEWLIGARTRPGIGQLGVSCGDNWLELNIDIQ